MSSGGPIALPAGYRIRAYRPEDAAALAGVEMRSSALFAEYGYPTLVPDPPTRPEDLHAFAAAHETWVAAHAERGPVGYAVMHPVGRFLHLRELAVDPAHGRRGLGAGLLEWTVHRSVQERFEGVSLTTFRRLPFNERFYAGRRFVECPLQDAPRPLVRQFQAELPPGIAPATRLLMLRRNKS